MPTAPSHATPNVLRWAREKAHLTIDDVGNRLKVTPERVGEWEQGIGTPSLAMLRKIAQVTKRPLAMFYLPDPPDQLGIQVWSKFRTLAGSAMDAQPLRVQAEVRKLTDRMHWASEFFAESDLDPANLPAAVTVTDSPQSVGGALRRWLDLGIAEQVALKDDRALYNLLREKIESHGVLTFQTSGLEVDELRGVALFDSFSPSVATNTKDAYSARSFTLCHELAHLALRRSEVAGNVPVGTDARTERFCNAVAASTLVPASDLKKNLSGHWEGRAGKTLGDLANRYHVSRIMILHRLDELGLCSAKFFTENYPSLTSAKRTQSSTGGPKQSVRAVSNAGKAFTRLAIGAFRSGRITGVDLSDLLSVKLRHLRELEDIVYRGVYPQRKAHA